MVCGLCHQSVLLSVCLSVRLSVCPTNLALNGAFQSYDYCLTYSINRGRGGDIRGWFGAFAAHRAERNELHQLVITYFIYYDTL